ncbi:MAG: sulfite exporter TauE/SafE family protein [Chloroflexota bacterium]|nr:sulfite exporter TauE/SafE family protein [Chloroflexota bacterium]
MIGPLEVAGAALVLSLAGFTIGAIGFGFALSTTPFLLLFLDPQTVVIVVNSVAVLAFALVLIETRARLRFRELTPMVLAGVLGTPIGVWALSEMDPTYLRIGIALLVLAVTVLIITNPQRKIPKPRITGPLLGFLTGALVSGLSIGGPIIVLFFLGSGMGRQELRAAVAYFSTVAYGVALAGYYLEGLFTGERLVLVVAAAPMVAVGYLLAVRLTRHMNARRFRQLVVTVIVITSILVLARELIAL